MARPDLRGLECWNRKIWMASVAQQVGFAHCKKQRMPRITTDGFSTLTLWIFFFTRITYSSHVSLEFILHILLVCFKQAKNVTTRLIPLMGLFTRCCRWVRWALIQSSRIQVNCRSPLNSRCTWWFKVATFLILKVDARCLWRDERGLWCCVQKGMFNYIDS